MGTSYELQNTRRKNNRLAAQLVAVNELHTDSDGTCRGCNEPFPCPTRTVARTARRLATGDNGPRLDPRTAGETAVARYLTDDGLGAAGRDDATEPVGD
ncbi:hypothetical protein [Rhodococcus aetherivorans]|uniref:hypothetical protein n=1 Tax=Rhodococcus aetherivorans TaxID=191292 RepID=UPI00388EB702